MKSKYIHFEERLQKSFEQRRSAQLRCIVPPMNHRAGTLDFTSHDFLGITTHDFVKKQSIKAVLQWGAGSTASRKIHSHIEYQSKLEKTIAEGIGYESAMLYSSAFQIHSIFLPTFVNKQTFVFIDRFASPFLYHALEPLSPKLVRYEHNNMYDLERHLHRYKDIPTHQKLIISETLFAASGDYVPLRALIDTAHRENALLYVDDTHTMGIKGRRGLGLGAGHKGIDCLVGSFTRTGGCFGAYIALPQILQEYTASVIPSLAAIPPLPPAALGALDATLTLLPDMHHERTQIEELVEYTRSSLTQHGFDYGKSSSHIIPIHFEHDAHKQALAEWLEEHSIYLQHSAHKNQERPSLRALLCSWHTRENIDTLIATLVKGFESLSIPRITASTCIPAYIT